MCHLYAACPSCLISITNIWFSAHIPICRFIRCSISRRVNTSLPAEVGQSVIANIPVPFGTAAAGWSGTPQARRWVAPAMPSSEPVRLPLLLPPGTPAPSLPRRQARPRAWCWGPVRPGPHTAGWAPSWSRRRSKQSGRTAGSSETHTGLWGCPTSSERS